MDDQIWDNTTRDRVLSTLSTSFAVLATLLAAIGLYAVLAYGVTQRLREFGIRIALGAKGSDVRWLVLRSVTRIALIGGAIGAALAFGLGQLGRAMLIGVDGYDAPVIGGATLLVVIVALAGWSASRAARDRRQSDRGTAPNSDVVPGSKFRACSGSGSNSTRTWNPSWNTELT